MRADKAGMAHWQLLRLGRIPNTCEAKPEISTGHRIFFYPLKD